MKRMTDLLLPDLIVSGFEQLQIDQLRKRNIRLLLCDVDNTLSLMDDTSCSPQAYRFLVNLKKAGITPVLTTNNTRKHFQRVFAGAPNVESRTFCCKPFPFSIDTLLKEHNVRKEECAIFGDQLYTDILAGKLAGITTILCRPLSAKERADTKLMRLLERPVYRAWQKQGILKRRNHDG